MIAHLNQKIPGVFSDFREKEIVIVENKIATVKDNCYVNIKVNRGKETGLHDFGNNIGKHAFLQSLNHKIKGKGKEAQKESRSYFPIGANFIFHVSLAKFFFKIAIFVNHAAA